MALLTVPELNVAMDRLAKAAREGLVDPHVGALSFQAKLLLERIIKFTPAKSENQQRAAIRGDLLKIFQVRRRATIDAVIKRAGFGRLDGFVHDDKTGVHLDIRTSGSVITIAQCLAIHRANYSARGRTKTVRDRYLISPELFSEYLVKIYLAIGKAKAGWLPAASRLFARGLPGWVLRHSPGRGTFIDGRNAPRPFIEAHNTTKWAIRADEGQRILTGAIAARARDMDTYLKKMADLALKKAGLAA